MPNGSFTPEQIAQILEEFFKTVGTRQYVGARYVPIFGRKDEDSIEWDNTGTYEPLSIVLYQGNSYTSRQYVPVGVEITNQEFWALTGNYNAQVEQYRRETAAATEAAENAQETANDAIEAAASAQNDIDSILPKSSFEEITVKEYVDQEVSYISSLLPSTEFENETVVDKIENEKDYILNEDVVLLNVSTLNTSLSGVTENGFAISLSYDGINFIDLPNLGSTVGGLSDVYVTKFDNGYLLAKTISSTNDFAYIYTENFSNVNLANFNEVSVGLTAYRDANYPDASADTRKWTPKFFYDSAGNLFVLVSMSTNATLLSDAYGLTTRTAFSVFCVGVDFDKNNNTFTPRGNVFEFNIIDNGVALNTFFDLDIIYNNGSYVIAFKDAYYNDVCIATSATINGTYNVISKNIFALPYTEAPSIVKSGDGFYIYGQQYGSAVSNAYYNLVVFTKNFIDFVPIGFPRRSEVPYGSYRYMRNMQPFAVTKDFVKSICGSIPKIITNESSLFTPVDHSPVINSNFISAVYNTAHAAGRDCSIIDNSSLSISDAVPSPLYVKKFWPVRMISAANVTQTDFPSDSLVHRVELNYSGNVRIIDLIGTGNRRTILFDNNGRRPISINFDSDANTRLYAYQDPANSWNAEVRLYSVKIGLFHVRTKTSFSAGDVIVRIPFKIQRTPMYVIGVDETTGATMGFKLETSGNITTLTALANGSSRYAIDVYIPLDNPTLPAELS